MTAPKPPPGADAPGAHPSPSGVQSADADASGPVGHAAPRTDGFLFPRPVRPFAIAAGLVLTGLGVAGTILPLLPGTGFLVAAAWLFARSSPSFERWLLELPVVGPLLEDFRRGAGMPSSAKWTACLSIVLAVGLSMGRIPVLVGQVAWVLIGVAGVWYIIFRVPTKRGDAGTG